MSDADILTVARSGDCIRLDIERGGVIAGGLSIVSDKFADDSVLHQALGIMNAKLGSAVTLDQVRSVAA